jgi:iron complex outermembrane receptor protein
VNEWLLGAYYFEEDIYAFSHLPTDLAIIGFPPFFADAYKAAGDIHTEAWAVFGQFDWQLTEQLTLVLGARYSDEKVTIEDAYQLAFFVPFTPDTGPRDPGPPQPPQAYLERRDSASNDAFTPRAVVEFRPARDVMLYGSISRGFKSGGFTLANPLPAFKPEDLWAYELGAKSTLWEGRLRANAAMFYYDYSNLQVSKVQGRTIVVENAASAELYGVELEFTLLATPHLQIDGAASYLHSEYEDFESQDPGDFDPFDPSYVPPSRDLSGNQLYQAPNYTANVGVEYDWRIGSGSLVARGEMNYVSRNYYTAFNADILSEAANTRFNAFLSYVGGNQRWSATLYARNITDEVTKANALMGAIDYGGPAVGVLTPPRTYGVQIGFQL